MKLTWKNCGPQLLALGMLGGCASVASTRQEYHGGGNGCDTESIWKNEPACKAKAICTWFNDSYGSSHCTLK